MASPSTSASTTAPPDLGVHDVDPGSVPQSAAVHPAKRPSLSDVPIRDLNERMSLPVGWRIFFGSLAGASVGIGLGGFEGARVANFRYRAENAHRLPTTTRGWYFYHKTKNYVVALGGIKGALRMGPYLGLWTGLYVWTEDLVDQWRGGGTQRDFMSTLVAVLALNGVHSLWYRFPLQTAARMAKTSLKFGLAYGLLQDGVATLVGRKVWYIQSIRSAFSGDRPEPE